MARHVGVVEGPSYAEVAAAADRMSKYADVRFVRFEKIWNGNVVIIVEGDPANIQLALAAAKNHGNGTNNLKTELLTHTSRKVLSVFSLPGGQIWNP